MRLFKLSQNFGDVVLHYAQRGKTHWEAFHHKDEKVRDENVQGLRYLSGEFDTYFGYNRQEEYWQKTVDEFKSWLRSKGLSTKDEELSLGWLRVAKFVFCKEEPKASQARVRELIGEHAFIKKIELVNNNEVISRDYDDLRIF